MGKQMEYQQWGRMEEDEGRNKESKISKKNVLEPGFLKISTGVINIKLKDTIQYNYDWPSWKFASRGPHTLGKNSEWLDKQLSNLDSVHFILSGCVEARLN